MGYFVVCHPLACLLADRGWGNQTRSWYFIEITKLAAKLELGDTLPNWTWRYVAKLKFGGIINKISH
jgi:hypothetical protein